MQPVVEINRAEGVRRGIGTLHEGALHAQLKEWYRRPGDRLEERVAGYVVDLVRGEVLVEVQTGGFAPLRRKLEQLSCRHPVPWWRRCRSFAGSSG